MLLGEVEPVFDFVGYRIEEESFLFMETVPISPGERGSIIQERENIQFAVIACGATQQVVAELVGEPPIDRFWTKVLDLPSIVVWEATLAIGTDAPMHGNEGAQDIR